MFSKVNVRVRMRGKATLAGMGYLNLLNAKFFGHFASQISLNRAIDKVCQMQNLKAFEICNPLTGEFYAFLNN